MDWRHTTQMYRTTMWEERIEQGKGEDVVRHHVLGKLLPQRAIQCQNLDSIDLAEVSASLYGKVARRREKYREKLLDLRRAMSCRHKEWYSFKDIPLQVLPAWYKARCSDVARWRHRLPSEDGGVESRQL